MLLTKGVELSGYFDVLGRKMVRRFATVRRLAMFLVLAAALLSTFLSNDVALFIVSLCTEILDCCYRQAHQHHLKRPDAADQRCGVKRLF